MKGDQKNGEWDAVTCSCVLGPPSHIFRCYFHH